jgi:hypothetical protein
MLTWSESSNTANLNKLALRMDCRIKSGNDDMENHSRDALMRPSFAHHHQAKNEASLFAPGK